MRTSTDATFVLATIVPSNQIPGTMVNVEIHIRTICGGAFGGITGGVGNVRGCTAATTRFGGTEIDFVAHALNAANSVAANNAGRGL
ncbi:MAG: hypothetical protein JOZ01_06270 [Candidatus Eremiobacteraeota bacterium]|nr:hypothetical protein [Candidatus Eremiobacteraeota bacterium]